MVLRDSVGQVCARYHQQPGWGCELGHKQTDLIIMDLAKPLTRYHTEGYYTNWTIMG